MIECKYCHRQFKNINAYNAHKCEGFIKELEERRKEKNEEESHYEFECECCHRKFKTLNSLISHHGHCKDYHFQKPSSKYKISDNLYRCECGREFDNPQSLNAHLSHCQFHHECIGTEMKKRNHEIIGGMAGWDKFSDSDQKLIRKKALDIIKNKYYNGELINFWSNPNISEDIKQKAKNKLKESISRLRDEGKSYCRGNMGYYKGIHCDSSWELAYVVYCIDHNIPIRRCKDRIHYEVNGILKYYTPDFVINESEIIEIKGFKDKNWSYKKEKCKELNITIIDEHQINKYLDYVQNTYGKDFIRLYE